MCGNTMLEQLKSYCNSQFTTRLAFSRQKNIYRNYIGQACEEKERGTTIWTRSVSSI